jgi:hypothetical protein
MQVIGRAFSNHHRRKTNTKVRDLPIRKVSFSGCSLSSGCSYDSASTATASPRSATSSIMSSSPTFSDSSSLMRPDSAVGLDPLHLHAAHHQPPARLMDRPLIKMDERRQYQEAATFYDDAEDDEDDYVEDDEKRHFSIDGAHFDMVTSGPISPQGWISETEDLTARNDSPREADDYFTTQPQQSARDSFGSSRRPELRSHWSVSTVNTLGEQLDFDDDDEEDDFDNLVSSSDDYFSFTNTSTTSSSDVETPDAEAPVPVVVLPPARFDPRKDDISEMVSEVISPVPIRPAFKAASSYEAFIKRGGWKRRGIVFHQDKQETFGSDSEDDFCERRCVSDDGLFWGKQEI